MQTLQFLSQLHVGFYNSFYLKIVSLALTCYLSLSLSPSTSMINAKNWNYQVHLPKQRQLQVKSGHMVSCAGVQLLVALKVH